MDKPTKLKLKIKITILIFYFLFCFVGFSLIFIFPPIKFLFTDNDENDENKKYVFKNFAPEIYNNLNRQLISDIRLTKPGENCSNINDTLIIEHQYYGNFTRFYNNSAFCIKRENFPNNNFKSILHERKIKCDGDKKPCGILNNVTKYLLCINKTATCPLNNAKLDSGKYNGASEVLVTPGKNISFCPQYGDNPDNPLIIDIDIIYKYHLCLEKYNRFEKKDCEFRDEDKCYIEDDGITSKRLERKTLDEEYSLLPTNLVKLNLPNYENFDNNFCQGAIDNGKKFYLFSKGFVNFDEKDYENFIEEFPIKDKDNTPLNKVLEIYKSGDNFDILFYFFALVTFCWSLIQFCLKIIMFFIEENKLFDTNKLYIWSGYILFLFKLICFYIMFINHYSVYLEIKVVYLKIENDPRNMILDKYKKMRLIFITKILILWIFGFIMISIELIILRLIHSLIFICEKEIKIKERINGQNPPNPPNPTEATYVLTCSGDGISNEINLIFQVIEQVDGYKKNYKIKIGPNELFSKVEEKLKKEYTELKDKDIKNFEYNSKIIDINKTIEENGIKNDFVIIMIIN